ncbi:hypothetical protein BOW75_gp13 [Salmonella phage IME207]|uniref:Uncharacterized protein n=1 Tax=Salmonella phage IME207 TaxID=1873985 RepID=A0A1B1W2B1_9CAUD|nr:hypothetical protein BOW75_gp13 [Salmonella phage IME207]ANW46808.1 hypothetical protein [Salmonella phage IME207]
MKLIDLLVKELPKHGGWPDGAIECCRHYGTNSIDFYDETGNWDDDCYLKYGKDFAKNCIYEEASGSDCLQSISRKQYESALAESQKPVWNSKGLPPVGMHCEIVDPKGVLMYGQGESGEVIAHVENTAVIRMSYGLGCFEARFLRPSHSEAERKRNAAIEAIDWYMPECIPDTPNEFYHAKKIYDAIAAGKIPGVKLED